MTSKPTIRVLYFPSAKTAVGLESEVVELPATSFALSSLGNLLVSLHSGTKLQDVLRVCAWSVDESMVEHDELDDRRLMGGEVVAVIPPVFGG